MITCVHRTRSADLFCRSAALPARHSIARTLIACDCPPTRTRASEVKGRGPTEQVRATPLSKLASNRGINWGLAPCSAKRLRLFAEQTAKPQVGARCDSLILDKTVVFAHGSIPRRRRAAAVQGASHVFTHGSADLFCSSAALRPGLHCRLTPQIQKPRTYKTGPRYVLIVPRSVH